MFAFSDLMKSNFGDSATPFFSTLEPRLKNAQDGANALSPVYFETPVGERRVPRNRDPRKPNYEMIKDARKGTLSGFLRSGRLFRASDFVGIVNPKTAIITLNDNYHFETRCLAIIDEQPISPPPLSSVISFKKKAEKGADDEKTLRNLFYISLNHDELPSYHFWTKPGDVDPVTAGEPIDWGEVLDKSSPSPATTTTIATLEEERKETSRHGAEEEQTTQNKKSLGFLDRYNDTNLPGLGRRPSQAENDNGSDTIPEISVSPTLAQSPLEGEVLLQFNRGGMYLREFTHKALYAMACWLVDNEEEDEDEDEQDEANDEEPKVRDMFLDILEPGKKLREEKIVSVSRASNRNFQENIKPFLGRPDHKFRIRSTRYQSSWNVDSGFDSGGVGDLKYDLKLVRPNVGYCYCSANWHITGCLGYSSLRFERALRFLFDWKLSAYPNSNQLSLNIPGHGSFDLCRKSGTVVDASIQKIFAELSDSPAKPDLHPAEISIRDVVEDDTDESGSLGASPPRHRNVKNGKGPGDGTNVHRSKSGAAQGMNQWPITTSKTPYQTPSGNLDGLITGQSNKHILTKPTEIRGGPDLPSIHPRLFTSSEIDKLQERLRIAEASIVESDDLQERLRIAEEKLSEMDGLEERLKRSEDRARLQSSCPFCSQDWAGVTKQQQQDHLRLHQKSIIHQPVAQKCLHPDCETWLGDSHGESTYEAISEHLRFHVEEEHAEDGICEYQHCHTNMYALNGEQQEEHESMHHDDEETEKERDQLLQEVRGLEDTVTERNQLQQQVKHLQNTANERDRLQQDLIEITEERDMLQNQIVELERRLKAAPGSDEGMQTKGLEPETETNEDLEDPNQPEAPKRLRYCNICLKSVDKLSANAKTKHADKCETSVSNFLLFNPTEAKAEREGRKKNRDFVRSQIQEKPEESGKASSTGKKRKQKALDQAISKESEQEEVEHTNAVQQPESSKATGRKTLKRKNDTFRPPKDDDSEDEEPGSPKKKPRLKGKATKADKEVAPTRRSTRDKGNYQPPEDEEEDEKEGENAYDEPSSSAKGSKKRNRAAAVTTAS